MTHLHRVHGVCLMHTTGTAAGLLDSLKDKVNNCLSNHNRNYLSLTCGMYAAADVMIEPPVEEKQIVSD